MSILHVVRAVESFFSSQRSSDFGSLFTTVELPLMMVMMRKRYEGFAARLSSLCAPASAYQLNLQNGTCSSDTIQPSRTEGFARSRFKGTTVQNFTSSFATLMKQNDDESEVTTHHSYPFLTVKAILKIIHPMSLWLESGPGPSPVNPEFGWLACFTEHCHPLVPATPFGRNPTLIRAAAQFPPLGRIQTRDFCVLCVRLTK